MPSIRRRSTKRSRAANGKSGLRNLFRRMMFAITTVAARGADLGGSFMYGNPFIMGAAKPLANLVLDRLGHQELSPAHSDVLLQDSTKASDGSRLTRHWERIAEARPRRVRFEPAEIIKVESWKEETRQMHYSRAESESLLQVEALEDALDVVLRASRTLSEGLLFRTAVLCIVSGGLVKGAQTWLI
mmetsp:Transcript_80749/g.140165  ORF Transcript_80749/g.140165 Transcript_80749/m.140165 type:complete len:187 (+) Transcript_80749:79-639(+)